MQVDCHTEFYESQIAVSYPCGEYGYCVICSLTVPRAPDLTVNYEPLMFAEYLAIMASITGLWLGLSDYS